VKRPFGLRMSRSDDKGWRVRPGKIDGEHAARAGNIPHLATGVAAVAAIWALWSRRFHLARGAAAAQVSLILWGWALAQYPYLIPPDLTIRAAAAPRITLILSLWILGLGTLVLLPSLI
jgi:cytochrome bd-type quinol oxidase subunit 2